MSFGLNRRYVFWMSFFEATALSVVTLTLVHNWYPLNYFNLFGFGYKLSGFLAILFLLGPVLNTLFYKHDSEAYANDLSMIFIIKLVVLGFGLHIAYSQRPVLVVFAVERFVVVQAHQVNLDQAPPIILEMIKNSEGPPLVATKKLPKDDIGLLLEVMSGGVDIEYRPAQYERFEYQKEDFYERMCGSNVNGDDEGRCESVTVPLVYDWDKYATAVFDGKNASIKDILPQDPW